LLVTLAILWVTVSPTTAILAAPHYPDATEMGQEDSAVPSGASRYRLQLDQGENMIEFSVSVWGEVRRPGLYSVPEGTTLLDLISLAGGPTSAAKLNDVSLVRSAGVATGRKSVVEVNLDDFISQGDPQVQTLLIPDDTVVIKAKRTTSLLKWTSFVSVLALVANVVVNGTK
jgi:polysaccharide export outer membrane protein